jgi:hypothetical protein
VTVPAVLGLALHLLLAQESVPTPGARPTAAQMAEAADRFQRGTEMFEENNLTAALAEFRRAQSIAPSYRLLYNIGQVCYLLRDYPCALQSFSRYLIQGGAAVPPGRKSDVQRDIERLRARVARLRVVTDPPGAEVAVDDVVLGRTPLAEPLLVAAGRPRVSVTLAGYAPATKVVEVAAMETVTVRIDLQSLTAAGPAPARPEFDLSARLPPPSAPPQTGGPGVPVVPWVITGALAVAAGTVGALALRSAADLKQQREGWVPHSADLHRQSTRVKRLALATDVLIGSALLAAGVSTVLSLTAFPDKNELALIYRF